MTMPVIAEEWKLSSGLRDDMVLSVYSAYFAPDAEYQGGRVLLLHLIGVDEMEEPTTLKLSVGADWESADGGITITHPTKKQQRINSSTIYGHFITHAQEIPELVAELQRRPGGPLNSKVWEGIILHLQERELKFGKNIEPQLRLMPVEYFGLVADAAPVATPATIQQQAMVPPQVMGIPPVPSVPTLDPAAMLAHARAAQATQNGGSPLYNELVQLAKVSEWPVFLATVLNDARVLADDELAQQAIDQTLLYNQARAT